MPPHRCCRTRTRRFRPQVRAKDLCQRLTLGEKAALMRFDSPAIPRLGIKRYNWWSETLHGVARAGVATVFPQSIGMAAAWNDDLVLRVFTAVSDEARTKSTRASEKGGLDIYQGLTFWTPNVNIFRDLALRMAEEGCVLLQNRSSLLPLGKDIAKIAVIGPNANDSVMQWGNYNGFPSHSSTLLTAMQRRFQNGQIIDIGSPACRWQAHSACGLLRLGHGPAARG